MIRYQLLLLTLWALPISAQDYVIQYTSEDPPADETDRKERRYTNSNDTDNITIVPIDGENFNPHTKYHVKIIPRGEIDGPASEPTVFTTGNGGPDGRPSSTDMHRRPIYPVVGKDGKPLPTGRYGASISSNGKPIPTDVSGKPLGEDGQPLPTDASGNYVTVHLEAVSKRLPTDESGSVIYPVTKPDGSPLPTDASSNYTTDEGTTIEKDEESKPLRPDGQPLPTDDSGNYIYPVVGPDGSPVPTDVHQSPIYPVIRKDGKPLPTDASGVPIGPDGKPITTDESGELLQPLPTNASGHYVTVPLEEAVSKQLTTDESDSGTLGENVISPGRRRSQYCFISSHIELIVVLDTSNTVKVLDYRVMKELLKSFLLDHFDLSHNKVRVGVVKYGDTVEVTVPLRDYDHVDDLLHRISETRRVKGKPHLELALEKVADELLVSESEDVPKFVLLLKNGQSTGDFQEAAEALRDDIGAHVFVVEAGDEASYRQDTEITKQHKIIRIKQWRGTDSEALSPIADMICKIVPADLSSAITWPTRKTTQVFTSSRYRDPVNELFESS